MSLVIYLETNIIVSIALGRDQLSEQLLMNFPSNIRLLMPSICYLETLVAYENEEKRRKSFLTSLEIEISQARRNPHLRASSLLKCNMVLI